ncbi:hypothetical protein BCR42DRAFT_308830, partial [Absidia repens]
KPTYRQGTQCTTIDYIFCHPSLLPSIGRTTQRFLLPEFTDHAQINLILHLDKPHIGPGTWRFNTQLLEQQDFCELLVETLDTFFQETTNFTSKQLQWDTLKTVIKKTAIGFTEGSSSKRKSRLAML